MTNLSIFLAGKIQSRYGGFGRQAHQQLAAAYRGVRRRARENPEVAQRYIMLPLFRLHEPPVQPNYMLRLEDRQRGGRESCCI